MKRIIAVLCLAMCLLPAAVDTVFAEAPENGVKSLADLFLFDRDNIEKIEVIYPLDGDPAGTVVDKDGFLDIAEGISLAEKSRIGELDSQEGIWIIAYDENNEKSEIWLDKRAKIGCPQREAASAVTTRYEISNDDYIRLHSFLPEEATAHIPLENPVKNYLWIVIGSGALVFAIAFAIWFFYKNKRKGA